ncbi:MAG: glycoside hydrolase family 88 protein, partial [Bacteroidales bacterium]
SETHGIQQLDLRVDDEGTMADPVSFGLSFIFSQNDSVRKFGLSYTGKIQLFVNGNLVFKGEGKEDFIFTEYTYDRFYFDTLLYLDLNEGGNRIVIQSQSFKDNKFAIIRPVDELGNQDYDIHFDIDNFAPLLSTHTKWLLLGPFGGDELQESIVNPNVPLKASYAYNDDYYTWQVPEKNVLNAFIIPEVFTYHRESYADWHYGIGAMYMVMLELSERTGNESYLSHVKRYNDFIMEVYPYFKWEYDHFNAIRGSYHRLIRAGMLDDCGAPALSMMELALNNVHGHYDSLLMELADFIKHDQFRLDDGTFCRPEPVPYTIWADDLFMSVPFMLRMAAYTG